MRFLHHIRPKPGNNTTGPGDSDSNSSHRVNDKDPVSALHHETDSTHNGQPTKFKVSKAGDGDVAMGLFDSPDELQAPVSEEEEAKVVRKIDYMILPYLAVCYAFFYSEYLSFG